ncbi:phenazine biosynthesis protein PhzF, partial [Enterococcus faecalis]
MKITAYVASTFSKNHEGGNNAGVVFMTQPLT